MTRAPLMAVNVEWIWNNTRTGLMMSDKKFNGVVVFSATKAQDRERLGNTISKWLKDNPKADIVDKSITQSSDSEFHCLTITFFYNLPEGVKVVESRDLDSPKPNNNSNGNGARPQARH